jgi:hypothetical protein
VIEFLILVINLLNEYNIDRLNKDCEELFITHIERLDTRGITDTAGTSFCIA